MGAGVGALDGATSSLALAVAPDGTVFLASRAGGDASFTIRQGETTAAHVFVADAGHSVASLLASGAVVSGDLILVTGKTADGALALGASAAGVTIAGVDGGEIGGAITVSGATGLTLRNLVVDGGVTVTDTDGVVLAEARLVSLTLDGANNFTARDNFIGGGAVGIAIVSASSGSIFDNSVAASATGLSIAAPFAGSIAGNDVSGGAVGVAYAAAAALAGNRIHGATVGVTASVADAATALGAVAGSAANAIFGNGTGLQLVAGYALGQNIYDNGVGVTGSGAIGAGNRIAGNTIAGVEAFAGTVTGATVESNAIGLTGVTGEISDNVIDLNGVGVVASSHQAVFNNQLMFNQTAAILVDGAHDVQIAGNQIRSATGDAVRLNGKAYNVEIVSNVLWADSGYDINVADDSLVGFWSDYNTLYAGDAGKLVHYVRDFTDILDWQSDVALFDLHSSGRTVVAPYRVEPHWAQDASGVYTSLPILAGQAGSDTAAGTGDPAGVFLGYAGEPNLLVNGDFESALTDWTTTAGASTTTTGPTPYSGLAVLETGPAANAVAQQTVDLVAAGYSAAALDSGALQLAFGGRAWLTQSNVVAGLSLTFRDANGAAVGATVTVPAGADVGRWLRLFDTLAVPTGARSAELVYSVAGNSAANGVYLDGAYLAIIPRGADFDQGVALAGTQSPISTPSASAGRLALVYPELYVNWELNVPHLITWNSFGAASGAAVRIELWQDTASGPKYLSTIAASTSDTGNYSWTPSASGLAYGDVGLRIRIVSATDPAVFDLSAEPFAVPQNGADFYVATDGSNRNTGKAAGDALPDPVNLFRTYAVGAGATVHVAAGAYALLYDLDLSGSLDRGLGLDSGFTIAGPTTGVAQLQTVSPLASGAVIDLLNADSVTLQNLTLVGGAQALNVHGGSDGFSAANLVASGQSGDGFDIDTNSPGGSLTNLSASGEPGVGLYVTGTLSAITFSTMSNDAEGIVVNGAVASVDDNRLIDNRGDGLDLTLSAAATVKGNTIDGNQTGAYVEGANVTFGDADLAADDGNILTNNSLVGVSTRGAVDVVGNTVVSPHVDYKLVDGVLVLPSGATGIRIGGGHADYNYIYDGAIGLDVEAVGTETGNLISQSKQEGVYVSGGDGTTLTNNVIHNTYIGIDVGAFETNLYNDIIYDNLQSAVSLNANAVLRNLTIYEDALLVGPDSNISGPSVGVDVGANAHSVSLEDSIIVEYVTAAVSVNPVVQPGFSANYNLYYTGTGARIGDWLGPRTTLADWRAASGRDKNSLFGSPAFVPGATEFHVQSLYGSYHGGSLAVVPNAAGDGLSLPAGVLTQDAVSSPAIDGGDPSLPVGAETAPNGGIIEIGAYGGTAQASLSPPAFLTITAPNGGETLFEGQTASITWNSFAVSGLVDLSASSDGVNFTAIATGVADSGAYSWAVSASAFPAATTYVVKIQSESLPAISDLSNAAFAIAAPTHTYFVNGAATGGDFTSAAGDDTFTGLDAAHPMASLGALLTKYNLQPGDTVYVDAGTYKLTQNIVLGANESGTAASPITIIGDGDKTVFDRGSNIGGFYDFEFKGAKYVSLQHMKLQGAQWDVFVDSGSASTGVSLSNLTIVVPQAGNSGVYVGAGNDYFTMTNSNIHGLGDGGDGVELDGDNYAKITNTEIDNFSDNFGAGVQFNGGTGSTLADDNFLNDNSATTTSFTYNLTFNHLTVSGGYNGISTYRSSGLIENSVVHDTAAFGLSADNVYGMALLATGNTVYNVGGSNEGANALSVTGSSLATNNVVYNSYNGIYITGTASNNVVYGTTNYGILVDDGIASGNIVHDNANIGIAIESPGSMVDNNTIYDNAVVGVQIGYRSGNLNNVKVVNNTIVQAVGTAVLAQSLAAAHNYVFADNIVSVGAGAVGLVIPSVAQSGFSADYNLYDIKAGATFAQWSGLTFDVPTWRAVLGFDANGFAADPQFVNAALDDYLLAASSPAIDAGDPSLAFTNEPAPNGGRIDIGATGNTAQAGPSPSQIVQITSPNGAAKATVGQTIAIGFRTDGFIDPRLNELAEATPLILVNSDGHAVTNSAGLTFAASGYETHVDGTGGTGAAINIQNPDPSGPPASLFQSYEYSSSGVGTTLTYAVPGLADGVYALTLYFADPQASAEGQHNFNILVNGATPSSALLNYTSVISASGVDPYRLAGDKDNAGIAVTVLATASGGNGFTFGLLNESGYYGAFLNGFAISHASAAAPPTAVVSVSTDHGKTYQVIGSNVAVDPLTGVGNFNWTVDRTGDALLRVTVGGVTSPAVGAAGFVQLAPATHVYYINDGSTAGDIYTTAPGSDLNTGTSPDAPMADLTALFRAYKLQPGDKVYVDAGTYALATDLTLGASLQGTAAAPIEIIGAGASTILSRNSNVANAYAIEFHGVQNLMIENLAITGGEDAVHFDGSGGSAGITLDHVDISAFGNNRDNGVYIGPGNSNVVISHSSIHDAIGPYNTGVYFSGTSATVSDDSFSNVYEGVNSYYGGALSVLSDAFANIGYRAIDLAYTTTMTVDDNIVAKTGEDGIYVYGSSLGASIVSANKVSGAGGAALEVGNVLAVGNEVFGSNVGLKVDAGATGRNNLSHDNVYGATTAGNAGPALIDGNTIYDNQYGTDLSYTVVTFSHNLLYGNVKAGIFSDSSPQATIVDNTIVQSGGIAVSLSFAGAQVNFRDNIVSVTGGVALSVVEKSEPSFTSDWNDWSLIGGSTFAVWGLNAVATFVDWRFETSFDQNSGDFLPGFVNTTLADYRLAAGSQAIDRGDPNVSVGAEPGNNGGRVNLGFDGGTASATQSAAQTVQVLSPNGLDKLQVGKATTITFRTWGLAGATAQVEVSLDDGADWTVVAAGVALDANGKGAVNWTPTAETSGNTALVRVTAGGVVGVSERGFLIANGGHSYFVNDASTTGDEYTTAVGDNLNSGKTPDAPVASLQALLDSYKLGADDVVYVDAGTYVLLQDLTFDATQGGTSAARLVVQGATGAATVINRNKTNGDVAAINLAGGSYITFSHLTLTGGESGVREHSYAASHDISFVDDVIANNARDGVQIENGYTGLYNIVVSGSKITGQGSIGLEFDAISGLSVTDDEISGDLAGIYADYVNTATISGNVVHDNGQYGIYLSDYASGAAQGGYVANNRIFNNGLQYAYGAFGLDIHGAQTTSTGNTISGQSGVSSTGLLIREGAASLGDTVSGNTVGVEINDGGSRLIGDRIFENAGTGVALDGGGPYTISANRIYSNAYGINSASGTLNNLKAYIEDNLIYLNTDGAVVLPGGSYTLVNNTIYQQTNAAVALSSGVVNTILGNNIVEGDAGLLLSISADSLAGVAVDYNLYYRGATSAANVASVGGTIYQTLTQWAAADTTRNAHSVEGAPNFITPDGAGADNVLGGPDTALGGGVDDDFGPGRHSPAIDAGNAAWAPATDILGQSRHDDAATADTGAGTPTYVDIGAFEFQGASDDTTAPVITGVSNLPVNGGATDAAFDDIVVSFNKALDPLSADSAANYNLQMADANGLFDTAGAVSLPVTALYSTAGDSVTLSFAGPLAQGRYRLEISPRGALIDASGNALGGGVVYARVFLIDRSADHAPTAGDVATAATAGKAASVQLLGADIDPVTLTYAIVSGPKHGVVSGFDAAKGTFVYTAVDGYVGPDALTYSVFDGRADTVEASAAFTVYAPNTPPVAAPLAATVGEGVGFTLTPPPGTDAQTPSGQLVLVLLSNPRRGTAKIVGPDSILYVSDGSGPGSDVFTYGWMDTGTPVGGDALVSAPAAVSIAIVDVNKAPTSANANLTAQENAAYTFALADFPYSDAANASPTPISAVLVTSLPASGALLDGGAAVKAGQSVAAADIAAGKLVYVPAPGVSGAFTFGFSVVDGGGTAFGGQDTSAPATATLTLAPLVSPAPTTAAVAETAYANLPYVFSLADFPYSDANNPAPSALSAVVIVATPTSGTLTLGGASVSAGQAISASAISQGLLVYTPPANQSGAPLATFRFAVRDGSGQTSLAATATLDVLARHTLADGSYDVTKLAPLGAGYAFDTLHYSAAGRVLDILFSNGKTATYDYDSHGVLQDVAFANVTGAAYTAYDIVYGANHKPTTASYANGMTAKWNYNDDGSLHDVAFAHVEASYYTSCDVIYGADGKPAIENYSNGMMATWTYNSDGSVHDIAYVRVTGAPYTSYDVIYGANDQPAMANYSNLMTATWTYNSDGSVHDVAYAKVTEAAYTSYDVVYGANGRPAMATYSNGMTAKWSYSADGSQQTIAYANVPGAAYTNYSVAYGSNGKPAMANYSNGRVVTWIYMADGGYQQQFESAGKIGPASYASFVITVDKSGARDLVVYFDAQGHEVARATYTNGKPVLTFAARAPHATPRPTAAAVAHSAATAPVETKAPEEVLVAEAVGPAPAPGEPTPAQASAPRREPALAGVVLALAAARSARKRKVLVFDLKGDRFDAASGEPGGDDLAEPDWDDALEHTPPRLTAAE